MALADFKVLTFDCYGTLIDWESGITAALRPLLIRSGKALRRDEMLKTFARYETAQQSQTPSMIYSDLLAVVHSTIASEWGVEPRSEESKAFGLSVPDWPAFADSAVALQYLQRHYKLAILSNVDRASFKASNRRLGVEFDYIFTAQDIGSYKPNMRNFEYMVEKLRDAGHPQGEILHTAESLFHDHSPANKIGIASAWIYRRHAQEGFGATHPPESMPKFDFQFKSMQEMAKAHQEAVRLNPRNSLKKHGES